MSNPKKCVVVLGNMGVGKSTLCNSLVRRIIFPAGFCWISSLTTELKWHDHNGIMYGDTPGFPNVTDVNVACREIGLTRALRTGESYAFVFVCVLQAGRPSSSDLKMMRAVLDAVNDTGLPYSVVFNKVSQQEMELATRDDQKQQLLKLLRHGNRQPDGIFFYPFDSRLNNADNILADSNVDFENFVNARSFCTIRPIQVSDLQPPMPTSSGIFTLH